MKRIINVISLIFLLCFGSFAAAMTTGKVVKVPHHKSAYVQLVAKAKRVSLGDPNVLDIIMLKSNEVFLIGKKLGSTNLMAWDRRGNLIESIDIEVIHDVNSLKSKLHEFLPDEKIEVHSSQNRLVLSGQVSSQNNMMKAVKIAETYAGAQAADKATGSRSKDIGKTNVINLLSVGGAQQVMLEVTVAEVSRDLVRRFNTNFGFFESNGKFGWGGTSVGSTTTSTTSAISTVFNSITTDSTGLLTTFLDGDTLFSLALDIAKTNNTAKVLAEPTLTALSGAKAEFLAGGEYPIPVPDDDGISIEYKEYGVGVKFIPTILSDKKINLNLAIDVSEVAATGSITYGSTSTGTYSVPPFTRRSASSTLELADGQTIGIAGMFKNNVRDVISKFPGLGDLPIIGQLFRSQNYVSGETELVILVTPHLAKPIDRSKVRLPTEGFVEPGDLKYYLLGQGAYITSPMKRDQLKVQVDDSYVEDIKGGSEGVFGHEM
ncbi:type II and III secretion system protein family protein [Vibrio salinus]|uniref:type II and III secretion system protein family protein n=1 Tax=Vibrio salinus TaxID=2899784 RepID=UPI001E5D939C|nr:type II and III secretion system protein family protein [Vibrio salinus]MCE0494315.1 type II and III secretion system protein family protein [Vibrio salinus]